MEAAATAQDLSSAEAARRLERLGPAERETSRSVASIVAANVLTLFNAIIGVFFILILSLGLFADALFGLIAIVNSAIGIRQELKAKETLDQLALLVAPRAKVDPRRTRRSSCTADEVVPGDIVRVEPGDQLVADGEVVDSRGLTMDESLLTGESDGIRKRTGDRLLSGSFGDLGLRLLRARRRARGQPRGEDRRRGARSSATRPRRCSSRSTRCCRATTIVLVPTRRSSCCSAFSLRDKEFREAAQTATAGLITLIPEGLVLLMSVTLAVAAVRLARQNTLVQQMARPRRSPRSTRSASTRPGTLTDGTLELVSVEVADPARPAAAERALGALRRLGGRAQPHPGDDRRALPGARRSGSSAEVPFSSQWKWSGLTLTDGPSQLRARRARRARRGRGADAAAARSQRALEEHTAAGPPRGRLRRGAGRRCRTTRRRQPPPRLEPRALVVLEETLRPDAAETIEFMREQEVDLKLISGDARETVTAVAHARRGARTTPA